MGVEFLNQDDVQEFMIIAEKCHKDSAWSDYPFDHTICAKNIKNMVVNDGGFVCIYRKKGEIIGFFLAKLGSPLFSNVLFGMESGIYIEREHRGGRVALLMYNEFREWCAKNNAESLVEIYFGEDNEKTYNFFRKVGMNECGKVFRGGKNGLRT